MATRKPTRKATPGRGRKGMLPNQARRQSLVNVVRFQLEREDVRGERGPTTVDHYVVTSDYMSGDLHPMVTWVEFAGQVWRLPNQVIEQTIRHRDGMITELRKLRARERMAPIARADQAEAEAEGDKDLGRELDNA